LDTKPEAAIVAHYLGGLKRPLIAQGGRRW
jgi:hypothetical protein